MSRPRITVSLSTDGYESLRRIAALSGESMSATVAGLVDAVAPALSRSADLFEAAQRSTAETRATLAKAAEVADGSVRPHLQTAMRAYREAMASLEDVVTDAPDPRPSNHGGHTPTPPTSPEVS
jgi:hypothetical protein